ncbi:MAG TPA: dipeptidase [Aggregatilinea sp.]|uniref:dipeptidase n=1 Tax=Aggregatilinea sp. TaxID=2806333 RepID=UPI002CE61120|nr:dipeptidase [Aggregatilinea sp.]HML22611.1 dipeptidase [Aggregatilinea sp.]
MNPYDYADANRETFLAELETLLRIPSVSTLSEHKGDVRRAAEWLQQHLLQIGMTRAELFETPGHPLVYAEWLGAAGAPTVLVYGHYDVQPVDDPEGQWKSSPFEPVIRDGALYARGATDDKGQTLTQVKAVQSLMANGGMPVNIKFLIEGEEESGSVNLYSFIDNHHDLLRCDVAVISDTHILGKDQPSIVTGLRGMTYLEIEVRGPSHDLHSGSYGGVVHNPVQALVEILATMHDAEGHITIPGFYDKVQVLTPEQRADLAKNPMPVERLKSETGINKAWGEPEFDLHERIGIRPTLEINGIIGGWTGEGAKTVLPARAMAKVSCRLVPNQDAVEIEKLITDFVAAHTPPTVTSEVRVLHRGDWGVVDTDSPYFRAAADAYTFGFGKAPVYMREGGSIPVVASLQRAFDIPVILMGFGLPDDNLHGPNEKFDLECFSRGIQTAIKFYETIGTMH